MKLRPNVAESAPRCPLCRGDDGKLAPCPECETLRHEECAVEFGCSSIGCSRKALRGALVPAQIAEGVAQEIQQREQAQRQAQAQFWAQQQEQIAAQLRAAEEHNEQIQQIARAQARQHVDDWWAADGQDGRTAHDFEARPDAGDMDAHAERF